jgi:hypothetical protein
MWEELAIPEKQGLKYTVPHLNSNLANNLVPIGMISQDVHDSAMGE